MHFPRQYGVVCRCTALKSSVGGCGQIQRKLSTIVFCWLSTHKACAVKACISSVYFCWVRFYSRASGGCIGCSKDSRNAISTHSSERLRRACWLQRWGSGNQQCLLKKPPQDCLSSSAVDHKQPRKAIKLKISNFCSIKSGVSICKPFFVVNTMRTS